jgi:hypothetical protein
MLGCHVFEKVPAARASVAVRAVRVEAIERTNDTSWRARRTGAAGR